MYLALPAMENSKERVAQRVRHGGHHIPTSDIERRFQKSLKNLIEDYAPLVDKAKCQLNAEKDRILIFEQYGSNRNVDEELFEKLFSSFL